MASRKHGLRYYFKAKLIGFLLFWVEDKNRQLVLGPKSYLLPWTHKWMMERSLAPTYSTAAWDHVLNYGNHLPWKTAPPLSLLLCLSLILNWQILSFVPVWMSPPSVFVTGHWISIERLTDLPWINNPMNTFIECLRRKLNYFISIVSWLKWSQLGHSGIGGQELLVYRDDNKDSWSFIGHLEPLIHRRSCG